MTENGHAPGSQPALRAANEARLLDLLRNGAASSQAALVRASGLSPSTVSVTVRRLAERGDVAIEQGTTNGRRSVLVKVQAAERLAAGVDIGRTHARIIVGSSVDQILVERAISLSPGHTPDSTIQKIATVLRSMSTEAGFADEAIANLGVGLPGPVDRAGGLVTGGTILPAWVDVPIRDVLARFLPMPAAVENDANLGACAVSASLGPSTRNLLYVKVGSGVGAGVILEGDLLQGSSGLAGEIGHFPLSPGGQLCRCGRRGCLETVASFDSIRAGLAGVLDQEVSHEDVLSLALNGSSVTRRVVEEAGEALGQVLAAACTLLDPGMVVIGGPLVELGELALRPIRQGFDRHALSATAKHTEIRLSALGQRTEALGALVLALSLGRRSAR